MHSKAEMMDCIKHMRQTAHAFYSQAVGSSNHTFIEFSGLINEYIKVCEAAMEQDIDFMVANIHTSIPLPLKPHNVVYLGEKLQCIYGAGIQASPELRGLLIESMMGPKHAAVIVRPPASSGQTSE